MPIQETLSADGNTSSVTWYGGLGTFEARGTFGSGTVKLQQSSDDGTTWNDVGADVTLTANGQGNFQLTGGRILRGNLAGSTSPTLVVLIS